MAQSINVSSLKNLNALWSECGVRLPEEHFTPHFNIRPLQAVWAVHTDVVTPSLVPAEWGLIPLWAKPGQFTRPLTHARAETVWERPSFRNLIRQYRALVVVNGFYVWRRNMAAYISAAEDTAMALGAIWQYSGDGYVQLAILNTEPSESCQPYSTRFPVMVPAGKMNDWLRENDSKSINAFLHTSSDTPINLRPLPSGIVRGSTDSIKCLEL